MKILCGAVAGLAGLASAGLACPTSADLDQGIVFKDADGGAEVFRSDPSGHILSTYQIDEGTSIHTRLVKGVYVVELFDMDENGVIPGTRLTYAFPMPLEDLPHPAPGLIWSVKAQQFASGRLNPEAQVYEFDAMVTHQIGTCAYDMIPVRIRYPSEDAEDATEDLLYYYPSLGLSFLAQGVFDGTREYYDFFEIGVAP